METTQSLTRQSQTIGDIIWDALKEVAPIWYEGLWKQYSPGSYAAFKAIAKLQPNVPPQNRRVLDLFSGISVVTGAVNIGNGIERSLELTNSPHAKRRSSSKKRRRRIKHSY